MQATNLFDIILVVQLLMRGCGEETEGRGFYPGVLMTQNSWFRVL